MRNIRFFFQLPVPFLRKRTALKAFLMNRSKKFGRPINTLNIIFCTDAFLLSMNRDYLNHNEYTDIITFDLSDSPSGPLTAEIYISVDRIRENARKLQVPVTQELHRVVFHGVLHLLGYKDKQKADQALMRSKEDELLSAYFS